MGFFDWLGNKIKKKDGSDYVIQAKQQDLAMQKLAYEICVQRIAKAICKCEFRTFKKHREVNGQEYYRLNIRPNPNQSGTEFWQEFVEKLYKDQEVLMVELGHNLYLADSFTEGDEVTTAKTFKDVQVGDLTLNKEFTAENAAHFKLSNQKVKKLLSETMTAYSSLMSTAVSAYKNGVGMKAKLHVGRQKQSMDDEHKKQLQSGIKTFMSDPNACFMEYDGYEFSPFDTSRKGTQQTSRDIKAMMDDVMEVTSKAFLIPSNIANGEVTDTSKAVDDFLTFCLDAVIALIEDGLNHVLYGEAGYLRGDCVRINSQTIKHVDVFDVSGSIDKLIACGVCSINDILRILGDEPMSDDWAAKHWMTKNYIDVANGAAELEGGKKIEPQYDG